MPAPAVAPLAQLLARRRGWLALAAVSATALSIGYASLETQQRKWIFQAARAPQSTSAELEQAARAGGMESIWIEHVSSTTGGPIRLHALWAGNDDPRAPLLLYLHGARRDVARSSFRVEQLRELGFSVLAVDYRGFGNSTDELPSEAGVVEDAQAAWRWLAENRPGRARYVFGHSLGGAIAVQLAAGLAESAPAEAPQGVIVEGTFTSIGDMFATFKWGWLPVSMLITERFDSLAAVPRIKSPLLIVHGSDDALVPSRFGQALYEQATVAKRFVLIEGGTHSTTTWRGAEQYRAALREFFGLGKAG
ncbi:MAG: lysophospholipase [Burkholderiales bacterium]|nr:lysophospholipase [Burkholderiales bacterium]